MKNTRWFGKASTVLLVLCWIGGPITAIAAEPLINAKDKQFQPIFPVIFDILAA